MTSDCLLRSEAGKLKTIGTVPRRYAIELAGSCHTVFSYVISLATGALQLEISAVKERCAKFGLALWGFRAVSHPHFSSTAPTSISTTLSCDSYTRNGTRNFSCCL